MTQFPLVSIIIPCYNAEARLRTCLQSCIEQTYPHLEMIVVDNGSTDQTWQIAQDVATTSSRSFKLVSCRSRGANHARNAGFVEAQGEYIQWLDADDELDAHKIERQVLALEADPTSEIAYGDWKWCILQGDSCVFRMAFGAQASTDIIKQRLVHHWYPPHAYLLRRGAAQWLHDRQAWHPETRIGTDREYFTLAALYGFQFLPVSGAISYYNHWSTTQMSRAASLDLRRHSHAQMFQRFRQVVLSQLTRSWTGEHWVLLNQDWSLWTIAPATLKNRGNNLFWVQHRELPVGMTLNAAEARIVIALAQLKGEFTLEDHTYRVLRYWWKRLVIQFGVEETQVASVLCSVVGLMPEEMVQAIAPLEQWLSSVSLSRHATIDRIPLYAPMFTEQRFQILKVLDRLRVAELLTQVEPGAIRLSEPTILGTA